MVRKVNKPIFKPSKRQGKCTSSDEEAKMEASKSQSSPKSANSQGGNDKTEREMALRIE
jgi:hypothetical protein